MRPRTAPAALSGAPTPTRSWRAISTAGVLAALAKPHDIVPLKDSYTLEICFREHRMARRASWYPGAVRTGAYTVAYTAKDPIELMTARSFLEG